MAQLVFDRIQLGRQSGLTTPVAATLLFPGKATSIELDRSYHAPDEDWGRLSAEQPGRAAWGVRGASAHLAADARFEDLPHLLEMHLAGGVSPTGSGPYTWTYLADETSITTVPYTVEVGTETPQDQWRLTGCLATELTLGFDALSAPGNAPWTAEATLIAVDRAINPLTANLPAPSGLETIEGHLTRLYEGSSTTAYSALGELAGHLVHYRLTSNVPYALRAYGGTGDTATDRGLSGKAELTFEATLKVSSTAKTDIHDVLNAAGSVVQERRWRIQASGSGSKSLTIDGLVRFRTVGRADRAGESVYGIAGTYVYDPTLGARVQVTVVNGVSSL
jgi:hypothetical protein